MRQLKDIISRHTFVESGKFHRVVGSERTLRELTARLRGLYLDFLYILYFDLESLNHNIINILIPKSISTDATMTFNPTKDIPDLSGKVILITGGSWIPPTLHFWNDQLSPFSRHHRYRQSGCDSSRLAQPLMYLFHRPQCSSRRQCHSRIKTTSSNLPNHFHPERSLRFAQHYPWHNPRQLQIFSSRPLHR